MISRPDISIITLNYNTHELLNGCIESIIQNIQGISFDLFVIDNDSPNRGFEDICSKYYMNENITFLKSKENCGGSILNSVLPRLKGKYIVHIQPDAVVLKGSLERLFEFMETHQDAGAASGRLLNPDGSFQYYYPNHWNFKSVLVKRTNIGRFVDKTLFHERYLARYERKDIDLSRTVQIDQAPGACFIILSSIYKDDGYISDRHFGFYFGDPDTCKRVYDKGYKIFLVADADIIHKAGSSFKKMDARWKYYQTLEGLFFYFKKHHPYQLFPLLTAIVFDHIFSLLMRAARKIATISRS